MMKHFKINVGRKKLSSEYIRSKQNFDSVLSGVKISQSSFWKSAWFYGTVGMAGVAAVVGYKFYQSENQLNEIIITQDTIHKREKIKEFEFLPVKSLDEVELTAGSSVERGEIRLKTQVPSNSKNVSKVPAASEKEKISDEVPHVLSNEHSVSENGAKTTPKAKVNLRNSMPSISGVYNGDISWESFKDGVLFVGEDVSVKQFSIQYTTRLGDKITSVKGDKIPVEVASELESLGLNQTVFITNVVAGDERGSTMRFVSMDLNLKFK